MLGRNGPVVKSVESVLRLEGSLWGKDLWMRYVSSHLRIAAATGVLCIPHRLSESHCH